MKRGFLQNTLKDTRNRLERGRVSHVRPRSLLFSFFVLALFALLFRGEKVPILHITDVSSRESLSLLLPDGCFALTYIHSVHQTPVSEEFCFQKRGEEMWFHLLQTEFQDLGVGMISGDGEGGFKNRNGRFVLSLDREFKEFLLTLSPLPHHTVKTSWGEFPLLRFFKPNQTVQFRAKSQFRLLPRFLFRKRTFPLAPVALAYSRSSTENFLKGTSKTS